MTDVTTQWLAHLEQRDVLGRMHMQFFEKSVDKVAPSIAAIKSVVTEEFKRFIKEPVMAPTIDCAIICRDGRQQLVEEFVLPSVLRQGLFRKVLVVGMFKPGEDYRYLCVPPITNTTMDALIKRECAAAASSADAILYLCDDHMLVDGWASAWPAYQDAQWDILAPTRVVEHEGKLVEINNGMSRQDPNFPYVAGHAGIFRRRVLRARPWMAAPHDLYWDLGHSRQALAAGFTVATTGDLKVLDIDPSPVERARHFVLAGGKPWETGGVAEGAAGQ